MTVVADRIKAAVIAAAIALPAEGMRQYWYYDPPGIVTVCVGHTGPDIDQSKRYSVAECMALLQTDMRDAIAAVDRCVPGLPVHVLAAFGDAAFNIGPKIACDLKGSTAARMLKAGNITGACAELSKWTKGRVYGVLVDLPGLVKRRAIERTLCETGEMPA